jgi:acyl carrier protein
VSDLESRLKGCFSAVFPELSDGEIAQARHGSAATWDSLATVTLMGVVEEEFGLSVESDSLEQFASFQGILGYLRGRQVGS